MRFADRPAFGKPHVGPIECRGPLGPDTGPAERSRGRREGHRHQSGHASLAHRVGWYLEELFGAERDSRESGVRRGAHTP